MTCLAPNDSRTGDFLAEHGLLSRAQLNSAIGYGEAWDSPLTDVIMAQNWVRPIEFYSAIAQHFDMGFVDLRRDPPDRDLLNESEVADYARELTVPWKREDGRLLVATARPGPQSVLYARKRWGPDIRLVLTAKFDVLWSLEALFSEAVSHQAVHALAERDPTMSARTVITGRQVRALAGVIAVIGLCLSLAPATTFIALSLLVSCFYLGNFLFKAMLAVLGAAEVRRQAQLTDREAPLSDEDLPVFTVLVPMFREPEVLPILANALRNLDYPRSKLDIKIVLEASDSETIGAAMALGLEGIFEIVRVPPSQPQTKPKACNYALKYARGDYLVIYDAEDKPEPDQLKKVVAAFRRYPPEVVCVQCRLNYYNAEENWLTRLFTLDYSLWFDLMLPGLERLGIPIPLGGTSNHFKIGVLRELYAWDPYNVTEDADLGIRMAQKGYKVGLVNSTTFEEANVSQHNWIRQRSRWIKGYMQTLLVHTRRPVKLVRQVGWLGAFGFTTFIGGTVLSGLLNPLFWGVFLVWLVTGVTGLPAPLPPLMVKLSLLNLIVGNGLLIYQLMLAPFHRRQYRLIPWALTVWWYWILMSVAAWKGLWQLVTRPFYWEKTQHGISRFTASEIDKAMATSPADAS